MKVLAIGNSFSQDATRYLHDIAKADGEDLKVVNLYIGGCSLSRHYKNMNNDAAEYEFEFNGQNTGIKVSIKQAVQSDEWDIITFQQVSGKSVDYETYQPYLARLAEYVRYHAPKARFMIHQTWAYEQDSSRLKDINYNDSVKMFNDLKDAYSKAAADLGGVKIIPSGEAMQNLLKSGINKIHRDTFHASLGLGRYTLALTWYESIMEKSCIGNSFCDFDESVTEQEMSIAQESAHQAVEKY